MNYDSGVRVVLAIVVHMIGGAMLWGTAGSSSREGGEHPAVNYYGTLEDAAGQVSSIEYLAIGSRTMTTHIPVYGLGQGAQANPRSKTTFLDLRDIQTIVVAPGAPEVARWEGTSYSEATITLKSQEGASVSKVFLIESTRKLWCDELIAGARRIPQELRLPAIKKITILGVRSADLEYRGVLSGRDPLPVAERERRKNHSCSEAAKTLNELEIVVDQLPEPHQGAVRQLVERIQNWIGGLCSGS